MTVTVPSSHEWADRVAGERAERAGCRPMEPLTVRTFATASAAPETLAAARQLMDDAFGDRFSDEDWEHALGGWHGVIELDGTLVAHAAVVVRHLEVAGRPFRTGYVEAMATAPAVQGRGLGSLVMVEAAAVIRAEYALGVLSTGRHSFYERLGWERWRGPTYVRTARGQVRTADDDGDVLVLRHGASADLDLREPISCEERSGDVW